MWVARAGEAQGAGEGFEESFDFVVAGAAVHCLHMNVGARAAGEALEEVFDEFGLQVANEAGFDFGVDDVRGAAAEIDGGEAEGFVHGHEEITGTQDAALVTEGFVEGFAERNADVFDGVMLVDVEIAFAVEIEIECSVAGEERMPVEMV